MIKVLCRSRQCRAARPMCRATVEWETPRVRAICLRPAPETASWAMGMSRCLSLSQYVVAKVTDEKNLPHSRHRNRWIFLPSEDRRKKPAFLYAQPGLGLWDGHASLGQWSGLSVPAGAGVEKMSMRAYARKIRAKRRCSLGSRRQPLPSGPAVQTPPHTDGPVRRLASMPQADRPGCPDPKAVEMDMGLLVEGFLDRVLEGRRLEFHSDEYPAYERAIVGIVSRRGDTIDHETISSKADRTPENLIR